MAPAVMSTTGPAMSTTSMTEYSMCPGPLRLRPLELLEKIQASVKTTCSMTQSSWVPVVMRVLRRSSRSR